MQVRIKQILSSIFCGMIASIIFGFCDNYLMLKCSVELEHYVNYFITHVILVYYPDFKEAIRLADGIGNTISDALAICISLIMTLIIKRVFPGVDAFNLPSKYPKLDICIQIIGIIIGCLLGLFPLFIF